MSLEFHPWSNIFPLADATHLTQLAEDIRQYGQHEPITLYQGKILDGRNRYRACMLIGFEPQVTEMAVADDGVYDALYWMVKTNIAGRNLSRAQLAVVALDVLNAQAKAPYSLQEVKEVATLTGSGWSSVERLAAIQKRNAALVDQVRRGTLSISQASRDAGFVEYDHAPIPGISDYFGKGDKFRDATEPLLRYLNGWRTRDFEFRHVNPKEAGQRLKRIDLLLEGLQEARRDLADRAHKPQLTHVPRY